MSTYICEMCDNIVEQDPSDGEFQHYCGVCGEPLTQASLLEDEDDQENEDEGA